MQMKVCICSLCAKDYSPLHYPQKTMNKWEKQWYKCGLILLELGKMFVFCMFFLCMRAILIWFLFVLCKEIQHLIWVICQNGRQQMVFLWNSTESAIGILKWSLCLEWKIMAYLKIVQNFGESLEHFQHQITLAKMNYSWYFF